MRINCPLHGDDDTCDQPMDVTLYYGHPGRRHEPDNLGPTITDVDGHCRHAKQFTHGELPDADYEYLLEVAIQEDYDQCHASFSSKA